MLKFLIFQTYEHLKFHEKFLKPRALEKIPIHRSTFALYYIAWQGISTETFFFFFFFFF